MRDRHGEKFGRYEIGFTIGQGGFATSYAAFDPVLGRTVAVKIYHPDVAKSAPKILLNEAAACGRLSHPAIPVLHDYVETNGEKGLVFDFVSGRALKRAGKSRLPLFRFAEIAQALAYSHSRGVIHCDVKPHNIITADSGKASLVDFTVAEIAGRSIRDDPNTMIGTPPYMAPEIFLGSKPTGATDVYGLSVTLFEYVTGEHPFGKWDEYSKAVQNVMSLHPDIGLLRQTGVPEQLVGVLEAALAKSPESRPSMTKLGDELLRVADQFTIQSSSDDRFVSTSTGIFTPEAPSAKAAKKLRVFLCHASDDKPAVRKLYRQLRDDGFTPWLDEEDLVAGQDWLREITRVVRASDVVIVCLSSHAVHKQGFIQKEIRMALDVADEMPEGSIYLVPAKLEACAMPDRLSRWHWVELFTEHGYERLQRALALRANAS